jgi:hypothetical protein
VFEPDKAMLSTKTGVEDLAKIKAYSFEDTMNGETPSLVTIKKYQGEVICKAAICQLVYWLREQFNFAKNIQNNQIDTLAELIMADYWGMTLADIKFAFVKGVKGDYGEIFQNIDTAVLYGWVKKYYNQKDIYLSERHLKEKELSKKLSNIEVSERFKKMRQMIEEKQKDTASKKANFYHSIAQYCAIKDLDYEEVLKSLIEKFTSDYEAEERTTGIELEDYIKYRQNLFLENRSKRDSA